MKLTQVKDNTWVAEGLELIPFYKLDSRRCILLDSGLLSEREELEEAIARLHRWESAIQARGTRVYHRSLRILRANPSARVREELGEVLETLRKLGD